jgi:hypothetical protein
MAWLKKAISAAWKWLMSFTQFIDGPAGKFSHKRLLSVAAGVMAVRQLVIGDRWGAAGAALVAVILAVVSAVTKT